MADKDIKIQASEINKVSELLSQNNDSMVKALSLIADDLKAIANNQEILYSEKASPNLVYYFDQLESKIIKNLEESQKLSKKSIEAFAKLIEAADKA